MCDSLISVKSNYPKYIDGKWTNDIYVACGKCPVCVKNRKRGWIFRLLQEDKVSVSSYFVTLTYSNKNVPMTENGLLTLEKEDLQKYIKRLRKKQKRKIRYYAVGEYGGKYDRPHYHLIIFNVEDKNYIADAWSIDGKALGVVHIGDIYNGSIPYTLGYMDNKVAKVPAHKNDDRKKEFVIMSNGIGKNYLTPAIIKYHKKNLKPYVVHDGFKIKMPKYYMDKIFTKTEISKMSKTVDEYYCKKMEKKEEEVIRNKLQIDSHELMEKEKIGRWNSYQNYLIKKMQKNGIQKFE